MKLALIGRSVNHSMSPKLYAEMLGPSLESYDLLDISNEQDLPELADLTQKYDGINITSPYKSSYASQIVWERPELKSLGGVNTLTLGQKEVVGTNTDFYAVQIILQRYLNQFADLSLLILGSGVMARLTQLVAHELGIKFKVYSRGQKDDMSCLDLQKDFRSHQQVVVVNACSRQFIFQGSLHPEFIFWDFNYNFIPHQNTLPSQVKTYVDGQEMLRIQASEAIKFWKRTNPKLKC